MRIAASLFVSSFLAGMLFSGGCASMQERSAQPAPAFDAGLQAELVKVLNSQVAAWNRGDIDGFMQGYWKSDDLTFSSGGKTTRGWQATHDRYLSRYPNREVMGTLAFSELEAWRIDTDAALLLGRWRLTRTSDAVGGNFSLVMRRIDGQWRIIHDHTSAD